MEIKQFIKTTLDEIADSINNNSSNTNQEHFYLDSGGVDFDLAVLVSNRSSKNTKGSAKAGIKVAGIGGEFSNVEEGSSECISRIKFTVRYGNGGKARVIKFGDSALGRIS